MPTSPVKTRIPLTSFGHLITEVKARAGFGLCMSSIQRKDYKYIVSVMKQLLGIETPTSAELTGFRKYFNSYTLQGRRNCVLVTYGVFAVTAAAYILHRQNKKENQMSNSSA